MGVITRAGWCCSGVALVVYTRKACLMFTYRATVTTAHGPPLHHHVSTILAQSLHSSSLCAYDEGDVTMAILVYISLLQTLSVPHQTMSSINNTTAQAFQTQPAPEHHQHDSSDILPGARSDKAPAAGADYSVDATNDVGTWEQAPISQGAGNLNAIDLGH